MLIQLLAKVIFCLLIAVGNPCIATGCLIVFVLALFMPRFTRWNTPDHSTPWVVIAVYGIIPMLLCGTGFTLTVFIVGVVFGFAHGQTRNYAEYPATPHQPTPPM